MDLKDIRELVKLVDKSSVTQLKVEQEGTKISISKHNNDVQVVSAPQVAAAPVVHQAAAPIEVSTHASAPATESSSLAENQTEVNSPMVGTYYSAPSPDADDFVKVGDTVKAGDVLCIVEAMKIMNEIQADTDGKVVKILCKNGEPVEFGHTLFHIEK